MGERISSIEMIRRLVGYDTVSTKSNLALIGDVRRYLAGHGIASHLVPEGQEKANLFATIGPAAEGGIALSGHTDVVPVEGQPWSSDPFTLVERDGRLYGRGSADMKSFIAIALALVPEFLARPLKRPVHLCLSYDEEVGCRGAPELLRVLGRTLPKPALAIIGEPTSMKVVNAHKGTRGFLTTITGRDGHSSAPHRAANAISIMGRLIVGLETIAGELRAAGDKGAMPGLDFDPPWTTLSIGTVAGGTAHNIVARECRLGWEFRPLPGVDADAIAARVEDFIARELRPALAAAAPEGRIETQPLFAVPALAPEPGGAAEALALRLTGANRATTVAYASEAGQFQETGISAVLCGPGDIAQAHKPDEFIAIEQIAACEAFLRRLADWAAA
ncbi:MAG: acetylornithine deacetylase [Rhodospirillales bacterium]|nr:acetylornithine deacetylase [Rhodospirillales bacterium]